MERISEPNYFAAVIMQMKNGILSLVLIALLASCNVFKKTTITAKPVTKTSRKNPRFIDGIEVTPGSVVTSKHKTATNKHQSQEDDVTVSKVNTDFVNVNIEKMDWLQLKYAVMLDATAELLTNVDLLKKMEEWWGTKYCMGGSTKNCIDCSAFTQIVMQEVYKIGLPRTASEQYHLSDKIDDSELKEGDLVFFHTGGKRSREISHVGIYITNNKFVNASTSNGVTISDLNDPYWKARYKGGGRVIGSER